MSCQHEAFAARVDVNRLTEVDGGKVSGYSAEVRVQCAQCGQPFQFLGLPAGSMLTGAAMSVDGLEARLAICPQGAQANPIQRALHGQTQLQ